jgi:YfiH family protein
MARWVDQEGPPRRWQVEGWAGVLAWGTGRLGGVSPPPYATLNVSLAVGDVPAAVIENRRRAVAPAAFRRPVFARLVHGVDAVLVEGTGQHLPAADLLFTRDPSVVLAMTFADCVPLYWHSPGAGLVGIGHAGWRGTVRNLAGVAVDFLRGEGAAPDDVYLAVGPAIGPCCYQVDEPVARAVRQLGLDADETLIPDGSGHWRLDLPGLNRLLAVRAGVPDAHISLCGLCTACHPDWFFSHRREGGHTGRQGGFICRTTV